MPPAPLRSGRSRYQHLLLDGERFFAEKAYTQAYQIYKQALSLAPPGDDRALQQLCRCTRRLARKAQKREDFREVRRLLEDMLSWEHVETYLKALDYLALAESAWELQDYDAAESAIEQTLMRQSDLVAAQQLSRRLQAEKLHHQLKQL